MASEIRRELKIGPEEWARVEEIFLSALEYPSAQRLERVRAVCGDNERLRTQVEQMLAGHDETRGMLAVTITLGEVVDAAEAPVTLPCVVGAYQLLEKIGSGGMGAVYRAERADGQFRKQVAVKLIGGTYSTALAEVRFRSERQILARLEHPYIARLMDGGVSADGRQYIVMEYVGGAPIDRYVRERRLSIAQTVGLFEKVCEAVGYAHEQSVVHRDIKPSNLLVTSDGTPKLLDFGISKLRESDTAGEGATVTQDRNRPLTPDYASPEQLLGGALTPASDVYSLGVLLYELLSGRRPYDVASGAGGGLDRLLENEPEPPSAAASREGSRHRISRDLDAIVLKALARKPAARYESAGELKQDLQRYLAQRPVAARPRAILPRMAKLIVRRRWQFAAVAILAVATIAVLSIQRYQARRTSERNLESVRSIRTMFTAVDGRVQQLPASSETRRLLIGEVMSRLEGLEKDAGDDAELLYQIALCYWEVGRAWYWAGGISKLSERQAAQKAYDHVNRLALRAAGISGKGRDVYLATKVQCARAFTALNNQDFSQAAVFELEAENYIKRNSEIVLKEDPAAAFWLVALPTLRGQLLQTMNQFDGALAAWDEAAAALRKHAKNGKNAELNLAGILALHACYAGDPKAGLEQAKRTETVSREIMQGRERTYRDAGAFAIEVFAECSLQANQIRQALIKIGELTEDASFAFSRDSQDEGARWALADAHILAGEAHVKLGEFSRAAEDYRTALELIRVTEEFANRLESRTYVAQIHFGQGTLERAIVNASRAGGAAKAAHRKSACALFKQTYTEFSEHLRQHGGLMIESRYMMNQAAEALKTDCGQ